MSGLLLLTYVNHGLPRLLAPYLARPSVSEMAALTRCEQPAPARDHPAYAATTLAACCIVESPIQRSLRRRSRAQKASVSHGSRLQCDGLHSWRSTKAAAQSPMQPLAVEPLAHSAGGRGSGAAKRRHEPTVASAAVHLRVLIPTCVRPRARMFGMQNFVRVQERR